MRRAAALAALLAAPLLGLACCGESLSRQSRYVGTVTPDAACGQPSRGTLTAAKGRFSFAPDDGVLVLSGAIAPDGALAATLRTPGAATGPERKPFEMHFAGRLDAQGVTGRYVTPRCGFTVALSPA